MIGTDASFVAILIETQFGAWDVTADQAAVGMIAGDPASAAAGTAPRRDSVIRLKRAPQP